MLQGRARRIASTVCGTLGILLIFISALLGYARRSVFDERAFASHIATGLRDPRVSEFVAEEIADAVIKASPDLVGVRPIIAGLTRSIVSSAPFRAAAKRSARTLHHAIMTGTARDVVLSVKDVGALFESAAAMQPGMVKKIPPGVSAAIANLESLPAGERIVVLVRFGQRVRALAIALFLLGIALCVACVWLSAAQRNALLRLGIALTLIGLVLAIVARFGGSVFPLFMRDHEVAPVVAGLAGAFLAGLMVWAVAFGLAGLVLASASASLLDRIPLTVWRQAAWKWLAGPQPRMRLRLARGIVGAAIGAVVLLKPLPSLTIAAWVFGLLLAFIGLREAFVAALHLLPEMEPRTREERARRRGKIGRTTLAFGGIVVVAGLAIVLWALLRRPDLPDADASVAMTYNGSRELGERTLDQVMFPTTHNAMGSPDVPGWMFPNQSADIPQQLEDGVRAFMIDALYGVPAGDRVKTEMADSSGSRSKYEAEVGPEGMGAALRIRDRLTGKETGERDIYMCHGFCELGAVKLVPVLAQMRDFLVAHPGEILILVIQDEGVPPLEIARCFEESGLVDFVYRGPVGPPWPKLREMAESDERVLVLMENNWAGVAWMHPAFEVLQETPYTFHNPSEFSNKPNRGGASASLFLMNHWIETTPMPKPSNADSVNAHDFLLNRIRRFKRERGHLPNLVAVDFYRSGDLVKVVRELNEGEPPPAQSAAERPAGTR
ncbi:MAG: hypothetical protein ACREOU_12765 [Candidatus Eiseniibacteriota bacterium]